MAAAAAGGLARAGGRRRGGAAPADVRGPAEGAEEAVLRTEGPVTRRGAGARRPRTRTPAPNFGPSPGRVREAQPRERSSRVQATQLCLREFPGGVGAVASSRPLPGLPELVTEDHIPGSRIWSPRDGLVPGSRSGSLVPVHDRSRSPHGGRVRTYGSGYPERSLIPEVSHPKEAPSSSPGPVIPKRPCFVPKDRSPRGGPFLSLCPVTPEKALFSGVGHLRSPKFHPQELVTLRRPQPNLGISSTRGGSVRFESQSSEKA
ncbi:uncharacterized protein LOC122710034 [Cervus elaphus]|uniref:uncharacterized protein LOC122710034 n=1 Tax=Cervus elaphus TaxID=9860 RepID=UPI001CC2DF82|nr:uncharacterized protein LOC122710034 [Cervus elaphus]